METLGRAVIREWGGLLGMDNPVLLVTGQSADFFLTIYDGLDDPYRVTQPQMTISGSNQRGLWLNFNPKLTQKLLGEYPVISMEQARSELLSGAWSTEGTAPTEEDIYRSELVYCTDISGLTMPYYCFYLYRGEIGSNEHKIECRYVPAVAREYLNLPDVLW